MSLNKAMLIGNLGADPELKYTPNQLAVTQLNVATHERAKGADGNWGDKTEWHRVVVFDKTAEHCCQYLKKGRPVFVEGRLQTRKWQDKEGRDHYTTEIIAHTVKFLGAKDGASASAQSYNAASPTGAGESMFAAAAPQPQESSGVSFNDDDIPF